MHTSHTLAKECARGSGAVRELRSRWHRGIDGSCHIARGRGLPWSAVGMLKYCVLCDSFVTGPQAYVCIVFLVRAKRDLLIKREA